MLATERQATPQIRQITLTFADRVCESICKSAWTNEGQSCERASKALSRCWKGNRGPEGLGGGRSQSGLQRQDMDEPQKRDTLY